MSEGVQDGDHHLTDSDLNAVQGKLDKRLAISIITHLVGWK